MDRRSVVMCAGRADASQCRRVGSLETDAALEQLRERVFDLAALKDLAVGQCECNRTNSPVIGTQPRPRLPRARLALSSAMACRKAGTLAVVGVYGVIDKFPLSVIMNKGLTLRTAQRPGRRYMPRMLQHVQNGELDPSFLVTHRMSLEDAPRGYAMFKDKEDGCVRAVFAPSLSANRRRVPVVSEPSRRRRAAREVADGRERHPT